MNTPAAIIASESARNPGWTIGLSCSGAVDENEHFPLLSHSLTTGNTSRTATKATKSATPAEDTIAPDLASIFSDEDDKRQFVCRRRLIFVAA
jgi:hypothetical protein